MSKIRKFDYKDKGRKSRANDGFKRIHKQDNKKKPKYKDDYEYSRQADESHYEQG